MWISPLDIDRLRNAILWAGGIEQGDRQLLRQMVDFWQAREKRIEQLERKLDEAYPQGEQRASEGG